MGISEIVKRVANLVGGNPEKLVELEERVGYEIGECLERTEGVLEWNIECLRAVCSEVAIHWCAVLASLGGSDMRRPGQL